MIRNLTARLALSTGRNAIGILCFTGLFAFTALAQKQSAASRNPSVTWKSPVEGSPDNYAGIEICSACHQDEAQQFTKTVHAKAAPATAKFGIDCESCHGPGKAHADGMMAAAGDPQKTAAASKLIYGFQGKPANNSARCLRCHSSSHDQTFFDLCLS